MTGSPSLFRVSQPPWHPAQPTRGLGRGEAWFKGEQGSQPHPWLINPGLPQEPLVRPVSSKALACMLLLCALSAHAPE